MIFSEFYNSRLEPNPEAWIEQICAMMAVQWNDSIRLNQLIHPQGQIITRNFKVDSWPPSYAIVRMPNDRIFCYIDGTNGIDDIIGDVAGAYATPAAAGGHVHFYFLRAALDFLQVLDPIIAPILNTVRLYFVGHSMGGAAAHLAATTAAQTLGQARVQLLTFAEPRSVTSNFVGGVVNNHQRIVMDGDIVPSLPPYNAGLSLFRFPTSFASVFEVWVQRGTYLAFASSGQQIHPGTENVRDSILSVPNWSTTLSTTHYLPFYASVLLKAYALKMGKQAPATLTTIITQLVNQAWPHVPVVLNPGSQLNNNTINQIYYNNANVVRQQDINNLETVTASVSSFTVIGRTAGFFVGGGSMALVKATYFFQMDKYGWSESYCRNGSVVPINANNSDPYYSLGLARAALLGNKQNTPAEKGTPCVRYIRISDIVEFRDARIYTYPGGGLVSNVSQKPCDMPWTAIKIRYETTDPKKRSIKPMRGCPDSFFVDGDVWSPDASWTTRFNAFVAKLKTHNYGYPTLGLTAPGSNFLPSTMTFNNGLKAIELATGASAPAGTRALVVRGCRTVPKINGIYPLRSGSGVFYLPGFNYDPGVSAWQNDGTFSFMTYTLSLFDDANPETPTRRSTGRPFDSPRGRYNRRR